MGACASEGVRHQSTKVSPVDEFPVINCRRQHFGLRWWHEENEPSLANIAMKSIYGIYRLTLLRIVDQPRSDVYGIARREHHHIVQL